MLSTKTFSQKISFNVGRRHMVCKFIDNSENLKQCRENAKKPCGEMQPKFYYTSYAFLKALDAFH